MSGKSDVENLSVFLSFHSVSPVFHLLGSACIRHPAARSEGAFCFYIQFFIDIIHMGLYSAQRYEQPLSDLLVAETLTNEENDFVLTFGNPNRV